MAPAVVDPDRQLSDQEEAVDQLRRGAVSVTETATRVHTPTPTPDEWDRKMKENYEEGGALKQLVERGREDYRTENTSPLP